MDFNSVCRTCLGTDYLNPIFNNEEQHERISVALMSTTELKVELNDGLPQNLCRDCILHINKCLLFRVHCKETETKLLEIISNRHIDNNDVFFNDDNNIKDTAIHIEKLQENGSKTENSDVTLRIEYSSDDEKPLTDLFKQNENHDIENPVHTKNDNSSDNIKSATILKNNIIDTELLEKTNTECNILENRETGLTETASTALVLNETKIEDLIYEVDEKGKVICRICRTRLSIRSVDTHMNSRHPGADQRKVKCELCDTYVLKAKLNRHSQMMHGKNYSTCKYCKLELSNKDELLKHVTICTSKKKKRNYSTDMGKEMSECEICHKAMQKASLKMHQRIKHAGLGPVCDYCGKKFFNKFRLNEHLRSKHGYEKYKCTQCPFQSASNLALTNHERRHRGEMPFVCEVCGARFHAAHLLAQHAQSHRTLRTMQCDLCPATFKTNNSLHMHKIACHSNTRYKCTLCERAYSCRHYAVKHLRSVHRYSGPVPALLQHPPTV